MRMGYRTQVVIRHIPYERQLTLTALLPLLEITLTFIHGVGHQEESVRTTGAFKLFVICRTDPSQP